VIVPEKVIYIGTNAFQSCSSLKRVVFNGKPPSAVNAFVSVASNAHGYYLPKFRDEWRAVIGADGKWNGLIMEERVPPILTVASASVPYDTLTLRWTYPCNGDTIEYSLYRNTKDDVATATLITGGSVFDAGTLVSTYMEQDFMTITPQTSPLHYWIVAKNTRTGETETDHVEARRRFLLSVGYSAYQNSAKPIIQTYRDASLFRSSCVSRGGFLSGNASLLSNANATTNKIRNAIADFAQRTQPGDMFVFYITTHGGDYGDDSAGGDGDPLQARLVAYDYCYKVADLQTDIRSFSPGVAIVNIIMACHSFSLTGSVDAREKISEWIASCGFGQCLGNVAWITSCAANQTSFAHSDAYYSEFGYAFAGYGFSTGCADMALYGTEYKGGNSDGLITFGELARYAHEFSQGVAENRPSTVKIENEALLDRIAAGVRTSTTSYSRPAAPTNVVASKGEFDSKIKISWDRVIGANNYKIYRTPCNASGRTWVAHSRSLFVEDDATEENGIYPAEHYQYQVLAIGQVGKSELSDFTEKSVGWRGTKKLSDFFEKYRPSSMAGISLASLESMSLGNGVTLWDSYIAGLDPTNELSRFSANIIMSNDVPTIVWSPDLGSQREYTIYGKVNLKDVEWSTPTNSAHRFFKVGVKLAE